MSAFFIGGGGYTLPRSWAETMDDARLLVAEIDPMVTTAASEQLWLNADHPAIEVRHRDARTVLASLPASSTFDVVFGDAFHDISVPAHLVSREFNREIKARLRPRGFYVVNVVDGRGTPSFLAAMVRTLERDFPVVEVWVDVEDWSGPNADPTVRVTYGVVASEAHSPDRIMTSLFGIDRQWKMIRGSGPFEALVDVAPTLTDDFAPVDRLLSGLL